MSLKKKAVEGAVEGASAEVSKIFVGLAVGAVLTWAGVLVAFAKQAEIDPIATYPFAFFAVFVLGGLLGFAIGMVVRYFSLKSRINRENEIAALEAEVSRLKEKVESEKADARRQFESLNLGQADVVSLAYGERNGFKLSAGSDKFHLVKRRDDVFEVQNWFVDPVTINLTPEWNAMMNEHGDMFHEIWNPRKAAAYEPRRLVE